MFSPPQLPIYGVEPWYLVGVQTSLVDVAHREGVNRSMGGLAWCALCRGERGIGAAGSVVGSHGDGVRGVISRMGRDARKR